MEQQEKEWDVDKKHIGKLSRKNHTQRKWGTPQNLCLAFIYELEKQLFIKKTVKSANTKCKNFNIYNVVFFQTNKEKHWRYHYFTSPYQKSWWYDLQFLRYRVRQTEIGNDGSFFALLPRPHIIHVIQMYLKPQSYEVWFLRYGVRHIIFCHFGPCFTLLTQPPSPNNPENQNFEKLKKASRDHFTHVYQKSQSYDLCFLRYGARQTEFFLIFDHFLTFYPT